MIRSLPVSVSLATVAAITAACAVPDTAKTGLRLGDEANGAVVWTTDGREIAATDRIIYAIPFNGRNTPFLKRTAYGRRSSISRPATSTTRTSLSNIGCRSMT